ncbi:MAG: DUF1573 domain-containing protein [Patescibacteria group bacterium]
MNKTGRDPTMLIAFIVGAILFAALVIFVLIASRSEDGKRAAVQTYSGAAEDAPRVVLSQDYFNYGPLKNKFDIITHSFTITNEGKSDLFVYKLTTSCHCTTAQLIYNNESSPKWGMTSSQLWYVPIKPGESATVVIEYDPKQMINDGLIQRAIYIGTNDPESPELTYKFDAENNL